ncbi:hypothetical protein BDD12DRAFT_259989 [Trichophaea hybrida]|nr:hypothetical protein BDD12DRAFT_259989 [Trichophaea hybrida]
MSGYVRMGRGGAGNHITKEELQKQAEDIEAQEAAANKANKRNSTANQLAQEELASPPPGEYKHSGRGGAGNFFVPAELVQRGTTSPILEDSDTTEIPPPNKPSIRQWAGRGGAGNFAGVNGNPQLFEPQNIEEIELEERERTQQLQEEVRRTVDTSLPKPSSAHLGGSRFD